MGVVLQGIQCSSEQQIHFSVSRIINNSYFSYTHTKGNHGEDICVFSGHAFNILTIITPYAFKIDIKMYSVKAKSYRNSLSSL